MLHTGLGATMGNIFLSVYSSLFSQGCSNNYAGSSVYDDIPAVHRKNQETMELKYFFLSIFQLYKENVVTEDTWWQLITLNLIHFLSHRLPLKFYFEQNRISVLHLKCLFNYCISLFNSILLLALCCEVTQVKYYVWQF